MNCTNIYIVFSIILLFWILLKINTYKLKKIEKFYFSEKCKQFSYTNALKELESSKTEYIKQYDEEKWDAYFKKKSAPIMLNKIKHELCSLNVNSQDISSIGTINVFHKNIEKQINDDLKQKKEYFMKAIKENNTSIIATELHDIETKVKNYNDKLDQLYTQSYDVNLQLLKKYNTEYDKSYQTFITTFQGLTSTDQKVIASKKDIMDEYIEINDERIERQKEFNDELIEIQQENFGVLKVNTKKAVGKMKKHMNTIKKLFEAYQVFNTIKQYLNFKPINKALVEVINNDKITSLLEVNLFYIIRVYSDIQTQIKSYKEMLSALLNNVTENTHIVLGEKTNIGYDDKIFSDIEYKIPELKEDELENKKVKKVEEKENEDEATNILAKIEDIRNNGGFLSKFKMDEGAFGFLTDNKLGKLFTV